MRYEFTETPCEDAKAWLDNQSDAETAWNTCERGDWLWWALMHSKKSMPSKEVSVRYAKWCAERAKEYVTFFANYTAYYAEVASFTSYASDEAYAASAASVAADVVAAAYLEFASDETVERKAQADWIRENCKWKG